MVVDGTWEIKNGKLSAVAGKKNRTILLAKSLQEPFRIEFEATNYANPDGSIGDITILLNAEKSKNFFQSGYALTTGSYYNSCTTFYRLGKPIVKTEYSPLLSGKTYKVIITLLNGHIRYWLNDEIILEAWDVEALEMNPALWMGDSIKEHKNVGKLVRRISTSTKTRKNASSMMVIIEKMVRPTRLPVPQRSTAAILWRRPQPRYARKVELKRVLI